MNRQPYVYETKKAIVFSTSQYPLDPYLERQIDERFVETGVDALIMGQGPVLSLGYYDPSDDSCALPNNSAFAVTKETCDIVGKIDFRLGSACAADYYERVLQVGRKAKMALDIIMPCSEKRPVDVADLWKDSLLLDTKHGKTGVQFGALKKWFNSITRYDVSIGNYSRKKLVKGALAFLCKFFKYLFTGTHKTDISIEYYYWSTLRGETRLEVIHTDSNPLISIVIRTCGRPESLRKAINSVLAQTYDNIEVVIVEDGEPISRKMVEEEFQSLDIRYISTGKKIGRTAAANLGFEKAHGEWINMLDDDDFLFPEHLWAALNEAQTSGSDIVFLKSLALETEKTDDKGGGEIKEIHYMNFPRIDAFTMSASCKTPNNGVFFRKTLLGKAGLMNEKLGANEDWNLWLKLMTIGKWSVVNYATCAFVNPADKEAKRKREEAYKAWRGKQFDDLILFRTTPSQLTQYYLGIAEDFEALNQAGELERTITETLNYWDIYSEEILDKAYLELEKALQCKEEKTYTARQFNLWYCALINRLGKILPEDRVKAIRMMREREFPQYSVKRVHFAGFWPWFDKTDNFLLDKLTQRYQIIDKGTPEYLICSIFGVGFYEYVKYDCPRIFFSGENYSPDFNLVDYAMSFNRMNYTDRYLYVPEFYVDVRKLLHRLDNRPSYNEALALIRSKPEFCNFIYGDSKCCDERRDLFHLLNERKRVSSAGKWMNNMDNGFVADMLSTKAGFQRKCRFTIAVESYPHPGFITEKLTDAFLANTIPIYYGAQDVCEIFNEEAFIDVRKYDTLVDVVNAVMEIESNPEKMAKMMSAPVFKDCNYLRELDKRVATFLFSILDKDPSEAVVRAINGQPEVHQGYISLLQKQLSSRKH